MSEKPKTNSKKYVYFVFLAVITFFAFRDYTYVIPYDVSYFSSLYWPIESPYSMWWIVLMIASLLSMQPLIQKKWYAVLGAILFVGIAVKPIFIKQVPKQSALEFYNEREKELNEIINENAEDIQQKDIQSLGFEELVVEQDCYIFIVNSFKYDSYGLIYCAQNKLPNQILESDYSATKLKDHWYEYHVN